MLSKSPVQREFILIQFRGVSLKTSWKLNVSQLQRKIRTINTFTRACLRTRKLQAGVRRLVQLPAPTDKRVYPERRCTEGFARVFPSRNASRRTCCVCVCVCVCEKPRRTGTKTSRSADRSPVLPLRAASLPTRLLLIVLLRRFCNDERGGGNAGRSREDFSHGTDAARQREKKKKLPHGRQADAAPEERNRSFSSVRALPSSPAWLSFHLPSPTQLANVSLLSFFSSNRSILARCFHIVCLQEIWIDPSRPSISVYSVLYICYTSSSAVFVGTRVRSQETQGSGTFFEICWISIFRLVFSGVVFFSLFLFFMENWITLESLPENFHKFGTLNLFLFVTLLFLWEIFIDLRVTCYYMFVIWTDLHRGLNYFHFDFS